MSFFILPKNNNNIIVSPSDSNSECVPYISQTFHNYYNDLMVEINSISSDQSYNELNKIVNPYEYIYSKVPGSNFSVSKLKPKTNTFYDLLEIFNLLNIFDNFDTSINSIHFTPCYLDSVECHEMLRETHEDNILYYDKIDYPVIKELNDTKFDFLLFETECGSNLKEYITSLIQILIIILKNQSNRGISIIKLSHTFYKPVIDILYFLTSIYDKVYILKPNANNITSFDRFIVCKQFIGNNEDIVNLHKINCYNLCLFLNKLGNKYISSILNYDIPYYFKLKINEINIIFGQQQLEAFDLIINLTKNRNKEDKIESIKKSNIQKSVLWCEKNKIPCNKFTEKINIFLPINNENN